MVKKRRKYTREFKLEAVRLSEEAEEPVAEIARQLGIHPNVLFKWRERFAQDGEEAFPGHGKLRPGDYELRRLRRENARLTEERDFRYESAGILEQSKQMKFRFIHEHRERYAVKMMCSVLGVSRSGYYAWERRRELGNFQK